MFLGYYIFYETSGGRSNDTATVQKNFTANGLQSCLQFWYHMYGRTVNTLNVYTINNGNRLRIWSRSFNQGNKWYKAEATVNITSGTYTVSLIARLILIARASDKHVRFIHLNSNLRRVSRPDWIPV